MGIRHDEATDFQEMEVSGPINAMSLFRRLLELVALPESWFVKNRPHIARCSRRKVRPDELTVTRSRRHHGCQLRRSHGLEGGRVAPCPGASTPITGATLCESVAAAPALNVAGTCCPQANRINRLLSSGFFIISRQRSQRG